MSFTYEWIDLNKLTLDTKNPRFASSKLVESSTQLTQEDIIRYLWEKEQVCSLANGIAKNKGLHGAELIACVKENNQYVVLEGNRRVCACKLLCDRSLVPSDNKSNLEFIDDETAKNLSKLYVVLYNDRSSAQRYLSDRHINGAKKWSALEKNNFYYNLFNEHHSVSAVEQITYDKPSAIRNSIRKYQFFMDVVEALRKNGTLVNIEDIDYLPMVDRFMDILVGSDKHVGLQLSFNEDTLKYYCVKEGVDIYMSILRLIGEAFLIRKNKAYCLEGEEPKILSTEIVNDEQRKRLIIDDTRIKGLYELIKKYRDIKKTSTTTELNPAQIKLKQDYYRVPINSEQIDLKNLVESVTSSEGANVPTENLAYIIDGKYMSNSIIQTQTTACSKKVIFEYTDSKTGLVRKELKLDFYLPQTLIQGKYSTQLFSLLSHETYTITFNPYVIKLINELRSLNSIPKYISLFACSLRSLFELSIQSLIQSTKFSTLFPSNVNDLGEKVGIVINKINNKKTIEYIDESTKIGFHSLKNMAHADDYIKCVDKTNLGAHKAAAYLTEVDIQDIIAKLSLFVVIVNELLTNPKIVL